jgi:hypothetical protein
VTSVIYESCWILIEKSVLILRASSLVFTPLICLSSVLYLGARYLCRHRFSSVGESVASLFFLLVVRESSQHSVVPVPVLHL